MAAFQTAPAALDAVRVAKEPFHVVCADYWMPQMDGLELLLRIHQLGENTSGVLITATTEAIGAIEAERQKRAGVICVLSKPFRPEELISLVVRLARLTELQRKARRIGEAALALR